MCAIERPANHVTTRVTERDTHLLTGSSTTLLGNLWGSVVIPRDMLWQSRPRRLAATLVLQDNQMTTDEHDNTHECVG